jgi:hypothetical protein
MCRVYDGNGSTRVSHFSPKQAFKMEGRVWRKPKTRHAALAGLQKFKLLARDLTLAMVANSRLHGRDFNQMAPWTRQEKGAPGWQLSGIKNLTIKISRGGRSIGGVRITLLTLAVGIVFPWLNQNLSTARAPALALHGDLVLKLALATGAKNDIP